MAKVIKGLSLVVNPSLESTSMVKVIVRYNVGLTDDQDMRASKEIEMTLSSENQAALVALMSEALNQSDDNEGI